MCSQCASPMAAPCGSRRRRLWDLPPQCHCPVVGVCLPLNTLRHWVNKALGAKAVADDYAIHVGAVADAAQRNRLSQMLQKDLDTRYARVVQAFRGAKCAEAVARLWTEAVGKGEVPGAFWAALTHPRCDDALQEAILRDMHMLQHQAGAAVRVDTVRFNGLVTENAVLARELGKAQERCARVSAEKSADIDRLGAELALERANGMRKDARAAVLAQDLERLKATLSDHGDALRLQKKVQQLSTRQADLESQNTRLRQQLGEAQRALKLAQEATTPGLHPYPMSAPETVMTVHLQQKSVLCVGGRNGNVANYRDVIEKAGGRFAHHDGGLEDNPNTLDYCLAAADLVICQTGCINHNAYWRVKDFCKRTGKQCVYVENPSTSSLAHSLKHMVADDQRCQ